MATELKIAMSMEGGAVVVSEVDAVEKGLDRLTGSTDKVGTAMNRLTGSTSDWQKNMAGVDAAMRSTGASSAELSMATQKILDRYDPLGTKLRSLTADMALLRREMGNNTSDAAFNSFQGLENDIAKTQALMVSAGVAGAEGFSKTAVAAEKSMLSTAGAKRELMVIGHEAISGNF